MPFGGIYRIIDFTLSNMLYSGLTRAGILTQYRPSSLMDHLHDGSAWGMSGRGGALKILPPYLGREDSDWYKGTADAIYQNISFIKSFKPSMVMIVSGDHIYRMDYRPMIRLHEEKAAALTIATMEVPWEDVHRFGIMKTDAGGRVVEFHEKPAERISNTASMGIYCFRTEVLFEALHEIILSGGYDFGKDIITSLVRNGLPVYAYHFAGYWRDVGTIPSYWNASMDILNAESGLALNEWKVRTNYAMEGLIDLPPARLADGAVVSNSTVSRGCVVEGEVIDSILSPNVTVKGGARVYKSVVMHNCILDKGASVTKTILDKDVIVGREAGIGEDIAFGENREFPEHLNSGITVVGKGTCVPEGARIRANCIIMSGLGHDAFGNGVVERGETVEEQGSH